MCLWNDVIDVIFRSHLAHFHGTHTDYLIKASHHLETLLLATLTRPLDCGDHIKYIPRVTI